MEVLYSSLTQFFVNLAEYIEYDYLMIGALGLLVLILLVSLIRSNFTYEVKLLRAVNRLNRYFLREPYVNDENLIRFNRKMKKVPRALRYCWQEYMLNRDKAPSEYMSTVAVVDQPSKASGYANLATSIGTFTVVIAIVSFILSVAIKYNDAETLRLAVFFFDFFLVPILVLVLGFLFVAFMRARYTSIVADLYFAYHEFERNINKACTTLPQFIDYEILFTAKEIKEGIPVLQEYLEKRALQEKIEQEEAQLNALTYEEFDFEELGVENSLLLERALFESEKFFKVKTDLTQKIKAKETEMQNYQKGFDDVTKDYERKAQVLRETLSQLTEQINNTTIKIEANYMKKRYNEEQQRLQQLEKEYELSTNRFQKQQAELEEEINTYKDEIDRRKQAMQEAMVAEGRNYARKVYNVITADVQEQSRPYLEQMELTRVELEQAVVNLNHELQFKNAELKTTQDKLQKTTEEYQLKLLGLQQVKELKQFLTSDEFRKQILLSAEGDDADKVAVRLTKAEDKVEKLTEEVKEKSKELEELTKAKQELEKRVSELERENEKLEKYKEKLSKKQSFALPFKDKKSKRHKDDDDDDKDGKELVETEEKPTDNKDATETEKVEEIVEEKADEKPAKVGFFGKLFGKKEKAKQEEVLEVADVKELEKEAKETETEPVAEPETEKVETKEQEAPKEATVTQFTGSLFDDEEKEETPKIEVKDFTKQIEEIVEEIEKAETKRAKRVKPISIKPETLEALEKQESKKAKPKKVDADNNDTGMEKTPEVVEEKPVLVEEIKVEEKVEEKPETEKEDKKPKQKLQRKTTAEKPAEPKKELKLDLPRIQPKKVERAIAKDDDKTPSIEKEIAELSALKRKIEEESKLLSMQQKEYKNALMETFEKLEEKERKQPEEKPTTAKKSKIDLSLNEIISAVDQIKNTKPKK